ncbi:DNA polymerase iota isoform X2 [Bombina bombina]|uniref:DNA polymerase iota isoform X2 n=1 Tax=Bombina bombina TaxID=8345 RepID=UPI00235AF70B|nr:DNA polymerase iota isoform X2 [Bombina bombina]
MDSPIWLRDDEDETDWLAGVGEPDHDRVKVTHGQPAARSSRNLERPGTTLNRIIMHLDMDCFYAQVEMIRNPDLRNKPLGVQQKHIVVTCNYEARSLGVNKLMYIKEAKEKCPQLILVSGEDLTHYREFSYKVTELLEEFSPKVERLGFDENFIDITDLVDKKLQQNNLNSEITVSGHVYNNQIINVNDWNHVRIAAGSHIAAEIRTAVYSRLGLTGCAGVASSKLLSKLVSGTFKPNQQTVLLPESHSHLINSLNHLNKIPGIGYKTTKRLESLGLSTVLDLQNCPFKVLEKEIGASVAQRIQMLSRGEDDSPVTPSGPPQSLSDEDSFKNISTVTEVKMKLKELLNNLLLRLSKDGRTPHTLRLTIRQFSATNKWFNRESRQCSIPSHINQHLSTGSAEVTEPLLELLMKLFEKMINVKLPFHITLLNVCFSNLKSPQCVRKSIGFYLTQNSQLPSKETGRDMEYCLQDKNNTPTNPKTEPGIAPDGEKMCHIFGKRTETLQTAPLPEDVDMDVFRQLPEEIRKEIMCSPGIVRAHQSSQSQPSKGILNFFSKAKVGQSNTVQQEGSGDFVSKEQNQFPIVSDLDSSNVNLLVHTDSFESINRTNKETVDSETSAHAIADITHTNNTCAQKLNSDDVGSSMDFTESDRKETGVSFPKSVDVSVFSELPIEVQKELLTEWKQQKHTSKIQVKNNEKAKTAKGKRTHSSMQPNNLLKYFKPN